MQKKVLLFIILPLLIFPVYAWENTVNLNVKVNNETRVTFNAYSSSFYENLNDNDLDFDAFKHALSGYLKLKEDTKIENTKYLTIIDMSRSANTERFFVINMETKGIEHKSLVAHGRNSGDIFATNFSNKVNSHQSSLGFYKTAETYFGKHGFSLRLDGLEFSNSNARQRAVVIHHADYVSYDYIEKNGRLGRSYGCPSLPEKGYDGVINKIKEGSCLFIYHPSKNYLSKSSYAMADEGLVASIN